LRKNIILSPPQAGEESALQERGPFAEPVLSQPKGSGWQEFGGFLCKAQAIPEPVLGGAGPGHRWGARPRTYPAWPL